MTREITKELVQATNEEVFRYFREISEIPRASGKEGRIADYLVEFAKQKGFTVKRSTAMVNGKQTHNVVICKPASEGYESLETIILQSHIDMVCQKVNGSTHNFDTDPIELIEKDGQMTANGTTLGADDGIGVACMLAILASDDVSHPPIEALFTSDEEDGMSGALAVDNELISGKRLINIDTETEGTLYYGCAGGIDANFYLPITHEPIPDGFTFLQVEMSGLLGGHSGVEIHKKHANAHKLMARTLSALRNAYQMRLVEFSGGDKRNVITRNAQALISVETKYVQEVIDFIAKQKEIFIHEYEGIETAIEMTAITRPAEARQSLSQESLDKLLSVILLMPNDIQAMHGQVPGLVETSCNLGIIRQEPYQIYLCSLIRSFVRTKKLYVLEQMQQLAKLVGASFSATSDYPDWEPNIHSELIARFQQAYQNAFSKPAKIESIHAGLECGYFSEKFPDMDIIACGPTITGAHTPEETLDIESTEKVVELLLHVLKQMDKKPSKHVMAFHKNNHQTEEATHICQCIR